MKNRSFNKNRLNRNYAKKTSRNKLRQRVDKIEPLKKPELSTRKIDVSPQNKFKKYMSSVKKTASLRNTIQPSIGRRTVSPNYSSNTKTKIHSGRNRLSKNEYGLNLLIGKGKKKNSLFLSGDFKSSRKVSHSNNIAKKLSISPNKLTGKLKQSKRFDIGKNNQSLAFDNPKGPFDNMSKTSKSFYSKDNRGVGQDLRQSVGRYRDRLGNNKTGAKQASIYYKDKKNSKVAGSKRKHILPSQSLISIHNVKKKTFRSGHKGPMASNADKSGHCTGEKRRSEQNYFKSSFVATNLKNMKNGRKDQTSPEHKIPAKRTIHNQAAMGLFIELSNEEGAETLSRLDMNLLRKVKLALKRINHKSRFLNSKDLALVLHLMGVFSDLDEQTSLPKSQKEKRVYLSLLQILGFKDEKAIPIEMLLLILLVIQGNTIVERKTGKPPQKKYINIVQFLRKKDLTLYKYLQISVKENQNNSKNQLKSKPSKDLFEKISGLFLIPLERATTEPSKTKSRSKKQSNFINSRNKLEGRLKNFLNPQYPKKSLNNKFSHNKTSKYGGSLNYNLSNTYRKLNLTNIDSKRKLNKSSSRYRKKAGSSRIQPAVNLKGIKKNSMKIMRKSKSKSKQDYLGGQNNKSMCDDIGLDSKGKRDGRKHFRPSKMGKLAFCKSKKVGKSGGKSRNFMTMGKTRGYVCKTDRSYKKTNDFLKNSKKESIGVDISNSIRSKLRRKIDGGAFDRVKKIKKRIENLGFSRYSTKPKEKDEGKSKSSLSFQREKEVLGKTETLNFDIPDAYHEYDESLDEIIEGKSRSTHERNVYYDEEEAYEEESEYEYYEEEEDLDESIMIGDEEIEESVLRSIVRVESSPETVLDTARLHEEDQVTGFDDGEEHLGLTNDGVEGEGDGEKEAGDKESRLNKILKRVSLSMRLEENQIKKLKGVLIDEL